jgi:hypothetical protein
MKHNTRFELSEEDREKYIKREISPKLSPEERELGLSRIREIIKKYEGSDIHALSVLDHAAKRGRLCELMEDLEKFHETHLRYIDPASRNNEHYGLRVNTFFHSCYKKLRTPS